MSDTSQQTRYDLALQAAEQLYQRPEVQLLTELGLRIEDEKNEGGDTRSQQFDGQFADATAKSMGMETLIHVGRRFYERFEADVMTMLCRQNDPELRQITSGKSIPQVAASLATAAVVSTLAPPAWAIVATSILAHKVVDIGIQVLCEEYQEAHPGAAAAATASPAAQPESGTPRAGDAPS